jgi:hypothetical protein
VEHSKYHEFEDIEVKGDTIAVRESFLGGAIIDGYNWSQWETQTSSIELGREDVLGLIEALVDVAQLDSLSLIARLTGATFEVAS